MPFLALLLLLLAGPAWADSGMLMSGVANRQMPLDGLQAPTACYSERRLRTAYVANKGINIVRASDSTTTDIGFDAYGYPNKSAETTFCNATTCKLVTLYDQCGTNNLTQATDANRYTRQAGPGVWNASQATATTQTHAGSTNITPATGLVTLSAVAKRTAAVTGCPLLRENAAAGNRMSTAAGSSGAWTLVGGSSGNFNATATELAWHAAQGVINGASSVLRIDSTETAGTATGSTTAGLPGIQGAVAPTACTQVEGIIWDNYAMPADVRAYIAAGQRTFWGF